jgi:hypothetical protein
LNGWPLFVNEDQWRSALGLLVGSAQPETRHRRKLQSPRSSGLKPVTSSKLEAWLHEFCADPANADVSQANAHAQARLAFPQNEVSRDRVYKFLRENRPTSRGPRRVRR